MEVIRNYKRFFDDLKFAKAINFTDREWDRFDSFEWEVLVVNGLKNINGGYSKITIYNVEYEPDGEKGDTCYLICEVKCGKQNTGDGHTSYDRWTVKYNRNTKEFTE